MHIGKLNLLDLNILRGRAIISYKYLRIDLRILGNKGTGRILLLSIHNFVIYSKSSESGVDRIRLTYTCIPDLEIKQLYEPLAGICEIVDSKTYTHTVN